MRPGVAQAKSERAAHGLHRCGDRRTAPAVHHVVHEENLMQVENDQSEIPAGRAADAFEQALEPHVKTIVQQLVDLAQKGDPTALRLCLERISPPLRERPLQFELPPIEVPADAVAAIAAITGGLADGELSAKEGLELARMVRTCVEILVLARREERVAPGEDRDAEERGTSPLGPPRLIGATQLHEPPASDAQLRQAA
jgi:hypothetical protein